MEIFGVRFFDFSSQVTYGDAFLTIAVVCGISFVLFLIVRAKARDFNKDLKNGKND